jgi:LPXTG-site transpeptidase (sortase) family protein
MKFNRQKALRVAGVFAGIGGFEVGLEKAGHKCVLLCENDLAAQAVLREHFKSRRLITDVAEIDAVPRDVDLLTAGFPCQDLSQVGLTQGLNGKIVSEGIKPLTLSRAAGHIPGTAFPDELGNVGIAGHRDTFFRKLGEVKTGDVITLTTPSKSYQYSVEWTRVVSPSHVEVLEPSNTAVLTLVTCYPFNYLGPAPRRFVVRARLMRPTLREQPAIILLTHPDREG